MISSAVWGEKKLRVRMSLRDPNVQRNVHITSDESPIERWKKKPVYQAPWSILSHI